MSQYVQPKFMDKIVAADDIWRMLEKIKYKSPLIFTNGCFDILHRGHVTYLAQARSLSVGGSMIVALNTDLSVKHQNKTTIERPINKLEDRLAVIASLESVDWVTYFDDDTPLKLIKILQPDILVKGGDWSIDSIVGANDVLATGGKVYSIPFLYNTSTTAVIRKILSN